jgi:hypothetical protein
MEAESLLGEVAFWEAGSEDERHPVVESDATIQKNPRSNAMRSMMDGP